MGTEFPAGGAGSAKVLRLTASSQSPPGANGHFSFPSGDQYYAARCSQSLIGPRLISIRSDVEREGHPQMRLRLSISGG